MRLAIVTSHPVQYYAPLFRELSRSIDVRVFFAHRATPSQQANAGFGTNFEWDIDLLAGYDYEFLKNVASVSGTQHFSGCDTPGISEALRASKFDAVLVTGWHLKSYWQAIWASKRARLPVMVRGDSHLDTPRSPVLRLVKRLGYPVLLRVFDACLYVGQRNLAYLRHYGYPDRQLFFSPHCVDNNFFAARATAEARAEVRSQMGIPSASPTALFAGKLVPCKRPLDVIRAAAAVRKQGIDLHVLVAGSGELEREMCSEAGALKVPLHLMGFQNQTAMPAAYAAADFLVLPSTGETWGLVANEAIASGRPIIVSDAVGCANDLAVDNNVGRSFPLGDMVALARSIRETVQTPLHPCAMKQHAERYSLSSAANGITAALKQLTA